MRLSPSRLALLAACIIAAVIIPDQILKIWIKTHYYLGQDYPVTSWFHLRFIENNGFAFGFEFIPKYILSVGRILAVALMLWGYARLRSLPGLRLGFFVCLSLIIAGAAGNIFDCLLYGVIFSNPLPPEVATLFPEAGGYASLLQGRVVDMLYFPLFNIDIAGQNWEFFQYVFNIADAAISVGIIAMIIFYYRDLNRAWDSFFSSHKKSSQHSPDASES